MSKEMYEYFLSQYPYGKHKDSWDTSNYHSEQEY